MAALRPICGADTEAAAVLALEAFERQWGSKYPSIAKQWRARWTQRAVPEGPAPQGAFPSDDSVTKLLYLSLQRAKPRWKAPHYWKQALSHFVIVFGDRFPA